MERTYGLDMPEALVPLVVLLAILAIDLWVYADARRWAAQGAPVVARIGSFAVETPEMWFLGCLVLFIETRIVSFDGACQRLAFKWKPSGVTECLGEPHLSVGERLERALAAAALA